MNGLYHKTLSDSNLYPTSHDCPKDRFKESMQDAGIETDEPIIADGILHRFHVIGDRTGSDNGWYVLYCKIRSKLDTQSGFNWTLNPELTGQSIRS